MTNYFIAVPGIGPIGTPKVIDRRAAALSGHGGARLDRGSRCLGIVRRNGKPLVAGSAQAWR